MTSDKHSGVESPKALELLSDAIESLMEGFALYDEDRRLVMCNQRYKEMNKAVADLLEPGLEWEILMRETARRGVYADAIGREEEFVRERMEATYDFAHEYELRQTDGSWYHVSTHPTQLGGFVVTRNDITKRKQAEAREREGDLFDQNRSGCQLGHRHYGPRRRWPDSLPLACGTGSIRQYEIRARSLCPS